ncbi:MAG: DUF1998 domain-containing protein [Phaeodactylibacter sp.]|nr:DUF1998 domain-containing protein [Phaeodactylibacter sp.]MCB9302637.1 DUF1998 domain-containing protein [Lewinellaceae bacterium]
MKRKIRRGQLLAPFGIGQMVNFPGDESLMICGPEQWSSFFSDIIKQSNPDAYDLLEFFIEDEPRLASLLGVKFFMSPPPFIERGEKNRWLKIPAVRFPQWYYCPKCKTLKKTELTHGEFPLCSTDSCKRMKLIPLRFVAVCEAGHIQDVPLMEWVHRGQAPEDEDHRLYYNAGKGSGDLASIRIYCSCKQSRSLAGIMGQNTLDNIQSCQGHRPWLGIEGIRNSHHCGRPLRVLIRGASNVYFPVIKSALYLPSGSDEIDNKINQFFNKHEKEIRTLDSHDNDGAFLRVLIKTHFGDENSENVYQGIRRRLEGNMGQEEDVTEQGFRKEEYDYIMLGERSTKDYKSSVPSRSQYKWGEYTENVFDQIVLIEKLKETRAFAGFSRIFPVEGTLQDRKNLLTKGADLTWLPAVQVYGEGIFFKLNEKLLLSWLEVPEVRERAQSLTKRYNSAIEQRRGAAYEYRPLDARFFLIHTLAHLMINRLCFNCGYGSSSLRERIYCSPPENPSLMNGFLIYTSSGDSEGSLGGLVRQGRPENLENILRESVEDSRWCSADPVCMEVGSAGGQGPDSVNGAACHNCAVIPETSCEEFNMLLDRAFVTGKEEQPELGFVSWLEDQGHINSDR